MIFEKLKELIKDFPNLNEVYLRKVNISRILIKNTAVYDVHQKDPLHAPFCIHNEFHKFFFTK